MRSSVLGILLHLLSFILLIHHVLGQQNNTGPAHNGTTPPMICVPFGTCEPCPTDALHEPFCQPFGNRRLMHCLPSSAPDPHTHPQAPPPSSRPNTFRPPPPTNRQQHSPTDPSSPEPIPSSDPQHKGETPAWESCGRIPEKERADFFEYLLCNFGIAIVAIFVVFARSRRLKALQTRQLAARIGLVRNTPGGWVRG